jgi:hypothetical protein
VVEAAQGSEAASEPLLLCRILWDRITGEDRDWIHAERKRETCGREHVANLH